MVFVEFSVLGHNEVPMGWNGISGECVGSRIRGTEYKLNTSCFLKDIVETPKNNLTCSSYSPIKAGCGSRFYRWWENISEPQVHILTSEHPDPAFCGFCHSFPTFREILELNSPSGTFNLLKNWFCKSRQALWLNYLKVACYFQRFPPDYKQRGLAKVPSMLIWPLSSMFLSVCMHMCMCVHVCTCACLYVSMLGKNERQ